MKDDRAQWEIFLQTIFDNKAIQVTSLQEDTVEIVCPSKTVRNNVELLLASPDALKASIIHSVFTTTRLAVVENRGNAIDLDISPKELIEGALDGQFLEPILKQLKLDLTKFERDESNGEWRVRTGPFNGSISLRLALGNFELLQSALSHPGLGLILRGGVEKINEQQPEDFISGEVKRLFVIEGAQSSLKITMNVSAYNSYMVVKKLLASSFEKEVQLQNANMVFDKKALIKYFNEVIETGIVYKKEQNGELTPIVALSSLVHQDTFGVSQQPNVIILMDVSGSMQKVFAQYKDNILSIISNVREKYNESEIIVYTFDYDVNTGISIPSLERCQRDTHANSKCVESLEKIAQLEAEGDTALFPAIEQGLSHVKVKKNDIILLCTDGRQYPKIDKGEEKILNKLQKARNENPQFSIYAFGVGQYDKDFFANMEQKIGIEVEDLGTNFDELSLSKHIGQLSKAKTVVQFLSSTGIIASMQITPDQPKVCERSLNRSDITGVGVYSERGREEKGFVFNTI